MRICGREFSQGILGRINRTVRQQPHISRRELSRTVCKWLDWRTSSGGLQEGSCRKALAQLQRQGHLKLPKAKSGFSFQRTRKSFGLAELNIVLPEVRGSIKDLGEIEIAPVASRHSPDSRIWRALLNAHHYLGSGTLCGAQIRYLIKSSRHGYLGALAFSSASWALQARDRHIGWDEAARITNLKQVVSSDRFLILPTVRVKNLASHVLAMALRRLPDDWHSRYRVRPALVETFVDPRRFSGACYKASNWVQAGHSAGRRDGVKKIVFLQALCDQWRELLCQKPVVRLGAARPVGTAANWAEHEFGAIRLYDQRLKQRRYTVAQDFYSRPQANIPEACQTKARTIGAYRFFQNGKITMDVLLTPHTEATIERIKEHQVVLAPQDTTILNYCTHTATVGLGPINNIDNQALGLILHDTLAFTEEGAPLGILDAQCWARDPDDKGKARRRKELPIEQKESMKWLRSYRRVAEIQKLCPDTMLVSIGDREADIYELFLEASKDPAGLSAEASAQAGPRLLVRAEKSRGRQVEQEHLWRFMSGKNIVGTLKIHIPKRGSQKAREAIVAVRFSEVQLTPPKGKACPPIKAWAVYILENGNDSSRGISPIQRDESPIEWMLLTTAAVSTFEDATQRVEWYSGRWGIEVYHRTLKTGCRIKDRQLGTADRLEACLGVDMVVAWRICHLTRLGREAPDHPCTMFFEDLEWKALCCYYAKTNQPPKAPPSMTQAIRMLGSIGGHLGRKSDGRPGTVCIGRGLQHLDTAVDMYALFTQRPLPQIRKSYPHAYFPWSRTLNTSRSQVWVKTSPGGRDGVGLKQKGPAPSAYGRHEALVALFYLKRVLYCVLQETCQHNLFYFGISF